MFRITSVARIAIEVLGDDAETEKSSYISTRPASDRARISVSRVPRNDPLFREVATALLDAVAALEGRQADRVLISAGQRDRPGHRLTILNQLLDAA